MVPALLGLSVLASLLRKGATQGMAPAFILGANLSDGLEGFFVAASALLGALGSFLLGSNTASNLAFGSVQAVWP